MAKPIDGARIRQVILEMVRAYSRDTKASMQTRTVLQQAAERLLGGSTLDPDLQRAMLAVWHDLFRSGHLAWGWDFFNAEPPFCHVTEQGRRALENISRDPANPCGYVAHLRKMGQLSPIVDSYVGEALKAYNSDCYKAAAVMIGAAAESVVIEIRDALKSRLTVLNRPVPSKIEEWQAKKVLDAIRGDLGGQVKDMPRELRERFESFWPAFTQMLRAARNDAGHPASVDPVTQEKVHANLLIFPELTELAVDLKVWIASGYH